MMRKSKYTFQPRPGFDWNRVARGRADSPVRALCSYCHGRISDDDVPLMLWKRDGSMAQFCDQCQREWWGVQ
jgi:hypothetical protein